MPPSKTDSAKAAIRKQFVSYVQQRKSMRYTAVDRETPAGFFSPISATLPPVDMGVIMVLVNSAGNKSYIDNRYSLAKRIFNQPLIEPGPTNGQWRHLAVNLRRENKYVYGRVVPGLAQRHNFAAQPGLAVCRKVQRFRNIDIQSVRDRKKFWESPAYLLNGVDKFL